MDRDAVDRIVDAVGAEHYRKRKSREDLGARLDRAEFWFRVNVDLRSSSTAREKRLSAAAKAASRLQLALDRLEQHDLPTKPRTNELRGNIQLLRAALTPPAPESELLQKAAEEWAEELHLKKRSALEWLVGVKLPQIFKTFFDVPVGFSRGTAKKALGPFIRFAEQALRELGITNYYGEPYSAETIARALSDVRTRRSRHKLDKAK